jgi:hypothetical protein
VSTLLLSELEAASWGSSWEPDARERRDWLDTLDDPPPDDNLGLSCEESDGKPIVERPAQPRGVLVGV